MIWFKRLIAALALTGLAASPVLADIVAPDALVKGVSDEVLSIVKQDKEIQSGNTKKVLDLVDAKVLPHFNFTHMTRLAVGRDWKKASPDQQKVLTEQFRTLLVRTYSNALTTYRNQTVDYKPLRMAAADTDVLVRTVVKDTAGKPISIDYSLEKLEEGWKVYDVVVGGVSLVTNYRETFGNEVRTGGIDGLIKSLQSKNSSTT